jgi:putative redox protein
MEKHHITSRHHHGMAFKTNINGHELIIDAAEEFGGTNQGPRPKALLLKALAGCTGMDVVSLLNKMRVEFTDFSIDVQGELTDEHPKVYHTITIEYLVKLTSADDQPKFEKAVTLSQDKYCGVSAMLGKVAELKWHVTYL